MVKGGNGGGGTIQDLIKGNKRDNVLTGTSGSDTILGLEGDDAIIGLDGDDTIDGGSGNEIVADWLGDAPLTIGEGVDLSDLNATSVILDAQDPNLSI